MEQTSALNIPQIKAVGHTRRLIHSDKYAARHAGTLVPVRIDFDQDIEMDLDFDITIAPGSF